MIKDNILHVLGNRVTPVGGGRGTIFPDEVFLHLRWCEVIVVLETTNLLQDGRTAHGQDQWGRGRREQCALEGERRTHQSEQQTTYSLIF